MKSFKGTNNVANSDSWFRDAPHYWAEASLPLAYAVACVEVVCKSSEKARILCNLLEAEIHHHCTNIGMFAIPCVRFRLVGRIFKEGREYPRRQDRYI